MLGMGGRRTFGQWPMSRGEAGGRCSVIDDRLNKARRGEGDAYTCFSKGSQAALIASIRSVLSRNALRRPHIPRKAGIRVIVKVWLVRLWCVEGNDRRQCHSSIRNRRRRFQRSDRWPNGRYRLNRLDRRVGTGRQRDQSRSCSSHSSPRHRHEVVAVLLLHEARLKN